jgi:RNA polymerase sigma-70 factor (ECF subfamily)
VRDDLELLSAWRDGDRDAGNELLARHFASLHRFFVNKVGDEAEDLIQNTLLACLTYIDKVAAASSFKAYLFAIAANQLYAHLRRRAREGAVLDFSVASAVELGLSPSAVVAQHERDQQLSAALQRLPLELQIVLELGYWEELSAREIATVLELPVGTAKSKVRKAKQMLAKEIERLARRPAIRLGGHPHPDDAIETDDLQRWVQQIRDSLADPAD